MTERAKADEIRYRMAEVRRDLADNAGDFSVQAQRLTDWRFYVRNYPWVVAGAALAAGFVIVPRRSYSRDLGSGDLQALAKLMERNQVVVERRHKPGMFSSLAASGLAFAANSLLKMAMGYMNQRLAAPPPRRTHRASERRF